MRLLAVLGLGIIVVGWWAVPLTVAAAFVPRRVRLAVILAVMVIAGPVMATLGVVDRGSAGALLGQLLTAFALAVFSVDVLGLDRVLPKPDRSIRARSIRVSGLDAARAARRDAN